MCAKCHVICTCTYRREHEWIKHGTCTGMPDEHTYFQTVLGLYEQDSMQFEDILKDQGVVPDDDQVYSVSSLLICLSQP